MFIASKYEEITPPKINDFVEISDHTYSKREILRQEFQLLQLLDFDVTFPTVYRFIERFCGILGSSHELFTLACYLGELTTIDIKLNKWLPSRIAISAIYLAKKMHNDMYNWSNSLMPTLVSELTEEDVRCSARDICVLIDVAHSKKLYEPTFKKYSSLKYYNVAQRPVIIRQNANLRDNSKTEKSSSIQSANQQ